MVPVELIPLCANKFARESLTFPYLLPLYNDTLHTPLKNFCSVFDGVSFLTMNRTTTSISIYGVFNSPFLNTRQSTINLFYVTTRVFLFLHSTRLMGARSAFLWIRLASARCITPDFDIFICIDSLSNAAYLPSVR